MAPTFSSLPTEVLLEILGHLPHPTLGTRLAGPSALIATALVNRQLRLLSQQLMFNHVRIKGKEQAKVWTGAVGRKWTTELGIEAGREDMAEGTEWLAKVFARGLSGKDGKRGRKLEVLEVLGVEEGELKDGWCRVEGLQDLVSLSISFTLPTHFPTPLFPNLRHLRLVNPTPFRPGPLPPLAAVTHLTLQRLPSPQPDWTACYPHLSHLNVLEPKTTGRDHLDISNFAASFIGRPGLGLARASLVVLTAEQAAVGPPVTLLASLAVARVNHELEQLGIVLPDIATASLSDEKITAAQQALLASSVLTVVGATEETATTTSAAAVDQARQQGLRVVFDPSADIEWR